jgi:CelD/BcsL family acetyltransferase involved in cellulose biosynthesis
MLVRRLYTPPVTSCEPIAGLDAARGEWSGLAERSGSVFSTWEWASTWWQHFGAGRRLELLRCERDGEAFAIVPLCASRRGPVRVLRLIGHGPADLLGPVCSPGDRGAAGEATAAALRAGLAGPWDVLLAERIPAGPLGTALGGAVLQREASPELEIAARSWEDYLASCSRNLREKLGRNTRKLERKHELRYRLCDDPSRLGAAMDALFRLHRERWGEASSFAHASAVPFHRDFAAVALERGWLRLWLLEVDGEPAAAWYGFRFGGAESFYQSGRNPRFDRFSVGFLVLMRSIEAAFEDGLDRYAFLRGDEPYKSRFARTDAALETRALGRSALLGAGIRAGSAGLRSPWLRRRVAAAMR